MMHSAALQYAIQCIWQSIWCEGSDTWHCAMPDLV